jgi:hypothetical protein
MSLWAQVDSETLAIYYNYYSSAPKPPHINSNCVDVPIPPNVDYTCAKAVKAADGTISIVPDPVRLSEKQWGQVREERNRLLTNSDWTQLADAPITNKAAWAAYRTALRNVPETQTDPFNIVWPTPPQ